MNLHWLDSTWTAQKEILVRYKELVISGRKLILLVEEQLILELKVAERIDPIHQAQLLSYMRSMNIGAGLIINFKVRQLRDGIKRVVL